MKRRRGLLLVLVVALLTGALALPTPNPDAALPLPLPLALAQAASAVTETPVVGAVEQRGAKKFGDRCNNTIECGFDGGVCDPTKKTCQCVPELPATNHIDKCGKEAGVNESCFFNEQCEITLFSTECRDGHCVCRFELTPEYKKDGSIECVGPPPPVESKYVDPAMIGVLVGMALMFVIICVVLRLFSKARWRENRTIFNTPNPRLMNVSLLRDSKLLHGNEQRRGSRASVRAPSRQPSMASLRPHSPSGSPGSRRDSKGSVHSATSTKSPKSPTTAHANHAHAPAIVEPAVESVTVEVQEPKA